MSPRGADTLDIQIYYSLDRPREGADGGHRSWELAIGYGGGRGISGRIPERMADVQPWPVRSPSQRPEDRSPVAANFSKAPPRRSDESRSS